MHRILELDPHTKQARVQPGVVLDDLRDAAEQYPLTFGPDPSTHNHCTLGGMIGNNSCGVHSLMAGKTDDNIEELEILTYDGVRMRVGKTSESELARIIAKGGRQGAIYAQLRALRDRYADLIRARFPHIPRRVSGYNLPWLLPEHGFQVARALVGSECTCVTVLNDTYGCCYVGTWITAGETKENGSLAALIAHRGDDSENETTAGTGTENLRAGLQYG